MDLKLLQQKYTSFFIKSTGNTTFNALPQLTSKHKINIEPPHISNLVLPSGLNYMLKKSHYNVIKMNH